MTIFGIGPVELLIIAMIALIVVGPERLPELLYQVGRGINTTKRLIIDLRNQAKQELGEDYDSFEQIAHQIRDLNPRSQLQELGRSLLDGDAPGPTVVLPPMALAPPPSEGSAALVGGSIDAATDQLDVPVEDSLSEDDGQVGPFPCKQREDYHAKV